MGSPAVDTPLAGILAVGIPLVVGILVVGIRLVVGIPVVDIPLVVDNPVDSSCLFQSRTSITVYLIGERSKSDYHCTYDMILIMLTMYNIACEFHEKCML